MYVRSCFEKLTYGQAVQPLLLQLSGWSHSPVVITCSGILGIYLQNWSADFA